MKKYIIKTIILITGIVFNLSVFATHDILIDQEDIPLGEKISSVSTIDPKIVILNNQNQKVDQGTNISNQPLVRVTGEPSYNRYSSKLRQSRLDAERKTENRIIVKLESARLMDEQKRLNKFFGTKKAIQTVVVAKNQEIIAAPLVVSSNEIVSSSIIEDSETDKVYIGIHGGQPSNLTKLQAGNINYHSSVGVSLGATDNSGLILESSLFYSEHTINDVNTLYNTNNYNLDGTEVEQLSGSLALKFTPAFGRFKPYAGVAISYNYWLEEDITSNGCYSINYCQQNTSTFDSVDLGGNVGVDFLLSYKVSLGFNMLVNLLNLHNNRPDNNNLVAHNNNNLPYVSTVKFENTKWLIASVNAKFYF